MVVRKTVRFWGGGAVGAPNALFGNEENLRMRKSVAIQQIRKRKYHRRSRSPILTSQTSFA